MFCINPIFVHFLTLLLSINGFYYNNKRCNSWLVRKFFADFLINIVIQSRNCYQKPKPIMPGRNLCFDDSNCQQNTYCKFPVKDGAYVE